MRFLVAIEPDPARAARVAGLAPSYVDAEIVIVSGVDAALALLDSRVPQLLLAPPLMSPGDDAALTTRIHHLRTQGADVQRLALPPLSSPDVHRGPIGRILRRAWRLMVPATNHCDARVFAAHINNLLALTSTSSTDAAAGAEGTAFDACTGESARAADARQPGGIIPSLHDGRRSTAGAHPIVTAGQANAGDAGGSKDQMAAHLPSSTAQRPSVRISGTKRPRRPFQDEWGIYDPEQCGFAALRARLEELPDHDRQDTKPRRRSAIIRR
jgi:hypothetical protein